MMKKLVLLLLLSFFFINSYAQDEDEQPANGGFKKENIFIGGSINLGFAQNTFAVGATPEIGYSISQWLDAGLAINLNYTSQRADPYFNNNTRIRSFNYGGGPFIRLYPIHFLMLHAQYEYNTISVNEYNYNSNQTFKGNFNSSSFLAGIGYTQRIVGQGSFYTMIMVDLLNNPNSPYRGYNNVAIPIIRSGFNFYLRPSQKK